MGHDSRFQFRGSDKLKDAFGDACDRLKTPQNTVFVSLVEFFLNLDESTQSELVRKPLAQIVQRKPKR